MVGVYKISQQYLNKNGVNVDVKDILFNKIQYICFTIRKYPQRLYDVSSN